MKAAAPDFEDEGRKVLCKCVPFSQDQLRDIIRSQKLKSVQEVLEIYGDGHGCEVCKPALSYLVDVVSCGAHEEDRSARFINDRVHANIQKDGTFSVVPRMRGGVTTPEELRRIADVAEKYKVPMVKVTGSQRIDLLGVKKSDLPLIWEELGMPSGQAYAKGVRMVKTCVAASSAASARRIRSAPASSWRSGWRTCIRRTNSKPRWSGVPATARRPP